MSNLLDTPLFKTSSYINGLWCTGSSTFDVTNPANGKVIASVTNAGTAECEQAIVAAKKAFLAWSGLTANQRANVLRKWFELITDHKEELANILTLEQGKPKAEAIGEIAYGASFIEWFAEEAKRVYGDTIAASSLDKRTIVIKQAVGVVSAITPWNFPNAMITRKAAAALAAGCTFVVRASELTPLSALALGELATQAGIPPGVFNVVVGTDADGMGKVLTQHPDVTKFTFTGSTRVGKLLLSQCATTVKKTSMELGGNAPFIVFNDADIDKAVQGAIASKFRNAGQTCISSNRIFVQKEIADEFIEKYSQSVTQLTLDDGFADRVDIGPMISATAVARVESLINDSIGMGASLHLGGNTSSKGEGFLSPTILTDVTNDMPIAKHEIFGPVAPIIVFDNEAEVIEQANDTEYGLAAYFYSENISRVWRVAEKLAFGMVGINDGSISNAAAPFGGVKQSGNGREGSKYGLDEYLEIKYLSLGNL